MQSVSGHNMENIHYQANDNEGGAAFHSYKI